MKIHVSDEAAIWYKDEMNLKDGDTIRLYPRYGGFNSFQRGFSLGISNEQFDDVGVKAEKSGVIFYIEVKDLWYFDKHDLFIEFNEKLQEPEFRIS